MVTSSSGVMPWSDEGRRIRTSGGRSSISRMKYSLSPSERSPSRSASRTRYESSRDRTRSASTERSPEFLSETAPPPIASSPGHDRLVGVNADANASAGRRIDVSAVFLVPRLQAAERRIAVVEIDALHARRKERRDRVLGRSGTPRCDLVAKRPVDRFERNSNASPARVIATCLLFGARGDHELGLKRAQVLAAGVHPRADVNGCPATTRAGTGQHLHGDRTAERTQPRGFEGTVERGADPTMTATASTPSTGGGDAARPVAAHRGVTRFAGVTPSSRRVAAATINDLNAARSDPAGTSRPRRSPPHRPAHRSPGNVAARSSTNRATRRSSGRRSMRTRRRAAAATEQQDGRRPKDDERLPRRAPAQGRERWRQMPSGRGGPGESDRAERDGREPASSDAGEEIAQLRHPTASRRMTRPPA